MIDEHALREMLQRRAGTVPAAPADTPKAVRRARRRLALNGALAAVAAVAVAAGTLAGIDAIRNSPVPVDRPSPAFDVTRDGAEVLRFTGLLADGSLVPGDLVAVSPWTDEERVLIEDLNAVYSAGWSADGRWLAYVTGSADGDGSDLWVAGGSQTPRVVATGADHDQAALDWKWSPTSAVLATIENPETLRIIDAATGEATDLGGIVGDLLEPSGIPTPWAWSPDRTRLVFGTPMVANGGSLFTVDVESGERTLLARLPGMFVEQIRWSPDGAYIAVQTRMRDETGHLYVMDADGSNIRLVADDSNSLGFAWSPLPTDQSSLKLAFGSEAGNEVRIWYANIPDGTAPVEMGSTSRSDCLRTSWGADFACSVTWSQDGAMVLFWKGETREAIEFSGDSEGDPVDELVYLSWDGGGYESPIWGAA